ncbi:leucine-rich repeat-containing protein 15-like [Lethenteron reissneri]|uniref:leucine-rich repeat-containing protein 15-like n=1 Tax=Lethenteron reissneri TaxID=7753 RepID=UPI002AB6D199|nr:leucine-rich repeat-containing protein 15-like [Lethenteron reissneri]
MAEPFFLNCEVVEEVKDFRYLGVYFSRDGKSGKGDRRQDGNGSHIDADEELVCGLKELKLQLPSQCSCSGATVNCGGKRLASVPAGIPTTTRELWLGSNQITKLELGVFDNLTELGQSLWLNDNQITKLEPGVFDRLVNLKKLWLESNQLTSLPAGVFDNLTQLTRLALRTNQLKSVPKRVFDSLTQLTYMDLGGNRLQALPEGVFDRLVNLQWLALNDNQLKSVPRSATGGGASLWLNDNQITMLELTFLPAGVFDNLTQITRLALRTNQLKSIPKREWLTAESLTS